MIVSWNWLKDYIDDKTKEINLVDYCDKMIMSGSNLETCEALLDDISKVVIGKIEKIEKHQDADKLLVCELNVGIENIQIVTGAKNVFVGAFVPVALHGSVIADGVKIKKGKLRGVESFGMLCSPVELGFQDKVVPMSSKDGIWILQGDLTDYLGMEIKEALKLDDSIIDFEITPNRPDCLSMIGMARETMATFDGELIYPEKDFKETEDKIEDYLEVEVKSSLCNRYIARVIKDVVIEEAPFWMQKRLMAAGVRPINNIVDITNFVMLEYGQPMHAFDLSNLVDSKLIVQEAINEEKFVTLDGNERTLTNDMLMIADGSKSVAIAGVMGGLNSEIKDDTKVMVLEAANFNADNIRKTSKSLGLRTESSSRFEKGIDANLCKDAVDRFCHLVEQLGAGKVVSGMIDIHKNKKEVEAIDVRVSRVNKVLGTDIDKSVMLSILERLECKVQCDGDVMKVTPPSVRLDLEKEFDFVEEIARIYGYDNLPMTLPKGREIALTSDSWKMRNTIKNSLCAMGANEIQTFSFVSPKDLDMVNISNEVKEDDIVRLMNSLGEDTSVMRSYLLPQMLEVLARNYSRKVESVRAFEIGTTFQNIKGQNLPNEELGLSIGAYGNKESFFTLKGIIIELLSQLGIKKENLKFVEESSVNTYHPGRCAVVFLKDENVKLGIFGELHPDVAENYGIDERAYVSELNLELISQYAKNEVNYEKPPKYPSMNRDIAVIVDETCTIEKLENIILNNGGELLKKIELFDIYRGKQVEEGEKSVAFSLTYRHDERTLTDEETDKAWNIVIEALKKEADGIIRDN